MDIKVWKEEDCGNIGLNYFWQNRLKLPLYFGVKSFPKYVVSVKCVSNSMSFLGCSIECHIFNDIQYLKTRGKCMWIIMDQQICKTSWEAQILTWGCPTNNFVIKWLRKDINKINFCFDFIQTAWSSFPPFPWKISKARQKKKS